MTEGKRIPLNDVRRISRVVDAFEAGSLTKSVVTGNDKAAADGLQQFVLLEPFTVHENSGEDPEATYGRYFSARAAQMAPTRRRVQVLRQSPGRPANEIFQLVYRAQFTADLHCEMTTEEIVAEIETLPGLQGELDIVGKGDQFGPSQGETEYIGNQWHIRYPEDFDFQYGMLAIEQSADNVRLFVDFFWPSDNVRRIFFGFPGNPHDLSPGAFLAAQSSPGFGWVQLAAECYHV